MVSYFDCYSIYGSTCIRDGKTSTNRSKVCIICVYVRVCVCVYVCVSVYVSVWVGVCLCVYLCLCLC